MLVQSRNSKQCPHTMEVADRMLIVAQVRCQHDAEHPGMHYAIQNGVEYKWMSMDKTRRFVEDKGQSL